MLRFSKYENLPLTGHVTWSEGTYDSILGSGNAKSCFDVFECQSMWHPSIKNAAAQVIERRRDGLGGVHDKATRDLFAPSGLSVVEFAVW